MMCFRKHFISLFFTILMVAAPLVAAADKLVGGVGLDWTLKNQEEREKTIEYYRDLLFRDVVYEVDKERFKPFKKDPNFRENVAALRKEIRKLPNRQLAGFYLFRKVLVVYGVKYNDDKYHVYYYDALGHLAYYDILDKPHDEFPHIAYQYKGNGKLAGISYYISDYDQYIFDDKKKFKGRWYGEKLYNKQAKVMMTRKLP